ncbi:MAG: prolipoprotein diacylglyceryl transferase [Actinobacteria bacterium]|nr:prolipoprotein diacylglyceryl transferase [Actinomycetota bacterium]
MELTLLWAALTGVGLAWAGTRIWPDRLPARPVDHIVTAILVGLLAGRVAAMLSQGANPLSNPLDVVVVRGGVHTGAAVIGGITAYLWSVSGRIDHLDAVAPAALLGLAGWHAGCVWRSACLGSISDLPWAWGLSPGAPTRHPVELYAAVAYVLAAWTVSKLPWRPLLKSGAALGAAALIRLLTEPMRPSLDGGPIRWYLAALALGTAALLIGGRLRRRITTPT